MLVFFRFVTRETQSQVGKHATSKLLLGTKLFAATVKNESTGGVGDFC